MAGAAAPAAAQQARITSLKDYAFGNASFTTDLSLTDNVCAYSSTSTKNYTVTASGSGTASAFTMTTGSATLPYEVEWANSTGATSGTALITGVPSTIFTSVATSANCSSGPTATSTLIVRLRATAATAASAGSYSGTLSITITPQ